MRRLTIEEVKDRLKKINGNIKIISTEYKGSHKHLQCECLIDGHKWEATWANLSSGTGCPKCILANNHNTTRHTVEYVREQVNKHSNCELLSTEYINNQTKLKFRCNCGNVFERAFPQFMKYKKMCRECSSKNRVDSRRLSDKQVSDILDTFNLRIDNDKYKGLNKPLSVIDERGFKFRVRIADLRQGKKPTIFSVRNPYLHDNIRLTIKSKAEGYSVKGIFINKGNPHVTIQCTKGHEYTTNIFDFEQGKRCYRCYRENNVGENHPQYNPNLTDEERLKNRYQLYGVNARNWSKEVYKRDFYRCVICQSRKDIEAHHLDSWDSHVESRFDINNGVTLCSTCHKNFHIKYGYGDNTRAQFREYALSLSPHII